MYYPLLRGRQNELLAIQELLKNSALSSQVVPIIEPVKLSPTLVNTIAAFQEANHQLILIRNPKVGSWHSDQKNSRNEQYKQRLAELLQKDTSIQHGLIIDKYALCHVETLYDSGIKTDSIVALCFESDNIKYYTEAFSPGTVNVVIPYAPAFRRIRGNKILIDDKFNKKARNADYSDEEDEFFSDDHLYYAEEGYIGFSDYSIIGKEYSES